MRPPVTAAVPVSLAPIAGGITNEQVYVILAALSVAGFVFLPGGWKVLGLLPAGYLLLVYGVAHSGGF
jgi:hypothetical protein